MPRRGQPIEVLRKATAKSLLSPRIGKRGPDKKTIALVDARKVFQDAHLEVWDTLTKAQIKDAKKDFQARKYSFDQVIGKPEEHVDVTSAGKPIIFPMTLMKRYAVEQGSDNSKPSPR